MAYIQESFSFVQMIAVANGVPILVKDLEFKFNKEKTQSWANSPKPVSRIYGREVIESISFNLSQSQAQALRQASPDKKLTGIAPTSYQFICTGDSGGVFKWVMSDLEYLNDGMDTASADSPEMMIKVNCIASEITNIPIFF